MHIFQTPNVHLNGSYFLTLPLRGLANSRLFPKRSDRAFAIFFRPPKRFSSDWIPSFPFFHSTLRFGSYKPPGGQAGKFHVFLCIYMQDARAMVS